MNYHDKVTAWAEFLDALNPTTLETIIDDLSEEISDEFFALTGDPSEREVKPARIHKGIERAIRTLRKLNAAQNALERNNGTRSRHGREADK